MHDLVEDVFTAAFDNPLLATLDDQAKALILKQMIPLHLNAGDRAFRPGYACSNYIVVKKGSVKVSVHTETGREIVLYRIAGGDSCMLTTACLLGHDTYTAEAVSETDVTAIAISRAAFEEMLARSASFRNFVFEGLAARLTAMFRLIEQVAFSRMDSRLAQKLVELSHGADTISITQAQLAIELGTAREVVTRVLAELQRIEAVWRGAAEPAAGRTRTSDGGADGFPPWSGRLV
jgi:CRP/FNR family transcriptional regulator